ncbi:methyltransferase [Pelotalea chapellei]|uniref:Methyltransferase n=1 Tax=Pelotalea chapellei TaxID=44671 RepID=A0ABS5U7A1_9BACT|nr:methyltransferase [Pelotalea chapellei]MBT1071553.1 methyltransferase [Pelotalea chapellei]
MNRASRNRLTEKLIPQFSSETLFDRIARSVCQAGCLPRKELYEAWEVARRIRRRFRGGRVIDLACGHGLLAYILLLLDDSSPMALAVDRRIPEQAAKLAACLEEDWPRLAGRVAFLETDLKQVNLLPDDLVVSVHACGALTDLVLERAVAVRARVAVLPCCHDVAESTTGGLRGWLDGPLAQDVIRASRLRESGYRIITQRIPGDITPKNRLLLGEPVNQ